MMKLINYKKISKKHIDVSFNVSNDDIYVFADMDAIHQVIYNLCDNAIRYNVENGKVTISIGRDGERAYVSVSDTGIGIAQEHQSRIFERFYRVDKARSRKSGGSGLGLAIVRSMVERNRGDISVESTLGTGTTFTVTFPIFDTEEEPL